jgi:branched-chain amino acid transport system ATP-binding protein
MRILEVTDIGKKFGALNAVDSVNLKVNQGEILAIIGPNGAGKSTLFKLITGFLKPSAGRVVFMDKEITGLTPHSIARQGLVRTFQETTIFRDMTALDNVAVSHHQLFRASTAGIFFSSRKAREDENDFKESAAEILEYLGLGTVMHEVASNLPHGYLRALGIAIALAVKPKLLLLDEPFAGMNIDETDKALRMIDGIRKRGVTIMLVEHDMRAVMRISDRIIVLNFGTKIAEGKPVEIQKNDAVIEAYLGRQDDQIGV